MTRALGSARTFLIAEAARLEARLRDREPLSVSREPEMADSIAAQRNREEAIREADRLTAQLRSVRAALERIKDGTYGVCESCGQDIPERRLNLVPTAGMCVACADDQERAEAESRAVARSRAPFAGAPEEIERGRAW